MTGWGWPRPRLLSPESSRPPGPRSCQLARYPRTTPSFRRPLWPSSRAGFAPIPTKSGASRASGLICGSRERRRPGPAHRGPGRTRAGGGRAGELVDQGQRRPRAGHCRRLWERLWGRRLELGANTYRVLVHPTPLQAGFGATSTFGSRADPRERGPPWSLREWESTHVPRVG